MNDKIIKGSADIILKNVKTGLIERIHSENTFQEWTIAHWLKVRGRKGYNQYYGNLGDTNAWKMLVGGLMLFRDQIPVGSEFMPAGNLMVGNAWVDNINNGIPTEVGSYNSVESSQTASAISQVYDFTTSQANGRISCACLSSRQGSAIGYGNASGNLISEYRIGTYQDRYPGEVNGFASGGAAHNKNTGYTYYFDTPVTNGVLKVTKRRQFLDVASIFESYNTTLTFDLNDIGNPYELANLSCFTGGVYDVGNNKWRMYPLRVSNNSRNFSFASGEVIYFYEFDTTTETLELKHFTQSASFSIATYEYHYNYPRAYPLAFVGDYAIISSTSGRDEIYNYPMYIFKVSTSELYDTVYKLENVYRENQPGELSDDLLMFEKAKIQNGTQYNQMWIYDFNSKTSRPTNGAFRFYNNERRPFRRTKSLDSNLLLDGDWCDMINNPLYLATINNLSTPIQKDATQTMKVIYVLEEI